MSAVLAIRTKGNVMDDPQEHPRLDWHLDNWARWMRIDEDELACKIVPIYCSGSSDFDTMVDSEDAKCAEALDALISDLDELARQCVYLMHLSGLRVVRFQRVGMRVAYIGARMDLSMGLRRKGIW